MKIRHVAALSTAALLIASRTDAQVISEDFSNPSKLATMDVAATLGSGVGIGIGPEYKFGSWVYSSANGGIDEPARGAGTGNAIDDPITSIGLCRPQVFRNTNARANWVVFECKNFTAGATYTVSFDAIGDAIGDDTGRYWLAELSGYDTSGQNFIQGKGSHDGWGAGQKPWSAFGDATVNYLAGGGDQPNGVPIIGVNHSGTITVEFSFTYDGTRKPDIGFAIGTYNNLFAIDNFSIVANR